MPSLLVAATSLGIPHWRMLIWGLDHGEAFMLLLLGQDQTRLHVARSF
jgi:hypothetical protein